VRRAALTPRDGHPEAVDALRQLVGMIDADGRRRMNLAVDQDGDSPARVAERFLGECGAGR
jgi:glycine betaine/choline ABC-type transport system substrate-binding protein